MTNDEPRYDESDPSAPVTRGEFDEGLRSVHAAFEHVATRADVASLGERADDLEDQLRTRFSALEAKIDRLGEAILGRIDSAVENQLVDFGAATAEQVSLLGERFEGLNERMDRLEEQPTRL